MTDTDLIVRVALAAVFVVCIGWALIRLAIERLKEFRGSKPGDWKDQSIPTLHLIDTTNSTGRHKWHH